jgi:transcriptional regulator with XRE-family HTH domain
MQKCRKDWMDIMDPGKWIRALREERSIKPSDIERITRSIADARANPDFNIPHSTLADIESGAIPSIHKLFSLALVLKVPLSELLLPFGIDQDEIVGSDVKSPEDEIPSSVTTLEPSFRFQLNFDTDISTEETTLLKIQSHDLTILPPALRARFDPTRYRYASIGSKDDSMADLLPPRSLVEIDTTQKSVQVFAWQTLRERPIYLVWHPDGHTCCWCQCDGRELMLIPHPLSRQRVRRFKMPTEATLVGRVTNAWLPFDTIQIQREAVS